MYGYRLVDFIPYRPNDSTPIPLPRPVHLPAPPFDTIPITEYDGDRYFAHHWIDLPHVHVKDIFTLDLTPHVPDVFIPETVKVSASTGQYDSGAVLKFFGEVNLTPQQRTTLTEHINRINPLTDQLAELEDQIATLTTRRDELRKNLNTPLTLEEG